MKKLLNVVLIMALILPLGIVKIYAEEIEPYGVIYCETNKGRHQMISFGSGFMFDEGGEHEISRGWRYYKCTCGTVVFCTGFPEKIKIFQVNI